MTMAKRILRSAVAIIVGWAAASTGYAIVMIVIGIFNRETFQGGVRFSTGWLLIALSVSSVCNILGGFVTAAIAQRSEMKHAVGLVLLVLALFMLSMFTGSDTSQVPAWYTMSGVILVTPTILCGGRLGMKQRLPPEGKSRVVARATDSARFLIALAASIVTFVTVVFIGFLLVGGGVALALPMALGDQALMFLSGALLVFGSFLSAVVFVRMNRNERDGLTATSHTDAKDDEG
jgi:hypothetical protein